MQEHNSINLELEQTVRNLGIPSCPKILLELSVEARKDDPDLQKIERLICADVGLSAALIKTVNSPFYGLRNKVHSIMQAIHMLGLSSLSLMVAGMVLRNVLKGSSHIDMARFWGASTKVAIISSYISCRLPYMGISGQTRRQIDKDEAYTFGLFQDCGIPIMLSQHSTYKDTLKLCNEAADRKFTDIEDEAYGKNHAMIGYLLAKSWGLPEEMFEAIRCHHEHAALAANHDFLPAASRDFIALALLAEKSIQIITGFNQTTEWQKGGQWVMDYFGLSEQDFNSIIEGIRVLNDEGNLND